MTSYGPENPYRPEDLWHRERNNTYDPRVIAAEMLQHRKGVHIELVEKEGTIDASGESRSLLDRVYGRVEMRVLSIASRGNFINGPWLIDMINTCKWSEADKDRVLAFAYERKAQLLDKEDLTHGAQTFRGMAKECLDGFEPLKPEGIESMVKVVANREYKKFRRKQLQLG